MFESAGLVEKEKPVPLGTSDEFCVVEVVVLELLLPSAGLFPNEKPLGFDGSEDWLLFSVGFEPNEKPPGFGAVLSVDFAPKENPPPEDVVFSAAVLVEDALEFTGFPKLKPPEDAGFPPNEKATGLVSSLGLADPNKPVDGCEGAELDDSAGFGA